MVTETWILLRGLSRELGHWGAFVPRLRQTLGDAKVVPLDLPGVGACSDEPWPGTMAAAMESIRRRAAPWLGRGRVFVFGVSLGGMVAMEWAAHHPGELAGIVVGASSSAGLNPFWQRFHPAVVPRIVAAGLRGGPDGREAAIVRTVSNRRDLWAATTAAWCAIQRERPVSAATSRAQLTAAARWYAPLVLDVPALFLVGATDRLVDAACSRALARRYRAPLVEHPTAGHDLTTDAPDWVAGELARWRADPARARR